MEIYLGHKLDSDELNGARLVVVREARAQLSLGWHGGLGTNPCLAYPCPGETLLSRIHCSLFEPFQTGYWGWGLRWFSCPVGPKNPVLT